MICLTVATAPFGGLAGGWIAERAGTAGDVLLAGLGAIVLVPIVAWASRYCACVRSTRLRNRGKPKALPRSWRDSVRLPGAVARGGSEHHRSRGGGAGYPKLPMLQTSKKSDAYRHGEGAQPLRSDGFQCHNG